jgi:Glycosyltransferase family 87
VRENALCASLAGAGSAALAWLGLYGFAWNDYDNEARPAFDALVHGHGLEFLRLVPAYGGSLVERAPFALIPSLWGGGDLAIYRMVALPCLLAAAVLGVWLVNRMRIESRSRLARAVALGICVANPLTLRALELGHPEELLGACMCVGAVLLASHNRPVLAGALLGLAIANKEWALLAIGPVLLALPPKRRLGYLALAGAFAAAILLPLTLVSSSGFVMSARGIAAPPATIFQPWQMWWFLGHHGALVHGLFGVPKVGYRLGPSWASSVSHPLILIAGLIMTWALWLSRRREAGPERRLSERDALLALALLLLMRCLLDTWDTVYYPLPFILALLAWEIRGPETAHPPVLALSSTALAWISFQWLPAHVSPDAQSAFFLAWTLPLAGLLAIALHAPRHTATSVERRELLREAGEPLVPVLANHG